MDYDSFKTNPRLYTDQPLASGAALTLESDQAHYLAHVMRLKAGDAIRIFNGRDGEYHAVITALKKNAAELECREQLKTQPPASPVMHLLFAPIKKHRMDFLVEKAVELGVTDLSPVIADHTEIRKVNEARLRAQITEAAEQCERLDMPRLHAPAPLKTRLAGWDPQMPLFWCFERLGGKAQIPGSAKGHAFLIGPVGGFSANETEFLQNLPFIRPVSLGPRILRAETAALACLALANTQ